MTADITRPTPEQIARSGFDEMNIVRLGFLAQLAEHGYVIVSPDDVPHATHASKAYSEGWSDCRAHIFEAT